MSEQWQEMDAWCVKRMGTLRAAMDPYIMKGGNLDDPQYRHQLGQHTAFMAMRSYIHGAVRAPRNPNP